MDDVRELKEDKFKLKRKIVALEDIIIEQNNLIETTGYKLIKREEESTPQNQEDEANLEALERQEMML
jgi:hypothetical protein